VPNRGEDDDDDDDDDADAGIGGEWRYGDVVRRVREHEPGKVSSGANTVGLGLSCFS
jgi:hypothetical protein